MQVSKKVLQSKYALFILFLLVIIISYYRVNLEKTSIYKGKEKEFRLTIVDKKYKDDQYTVILDDNEKLISYVKDCPFDVGDIIYIKGSLSKPKNNTIPNNYNYRMYLQSRGILWELKISESRIVRKNNSIINKIKNNVLNHINNIEYKDYLYVFLLGDTSYFNKKTRNIYHFCGLNYLLSIGSFQIMMIVKLLKYLEGRMKLRKNKSLVINIIVILIYILCTSKIIGVLRSGLCYIFSSILKYYKIKYKYQNIIFIVGSILLLINPYYIINTGFLYSFAVSIILSLNIKLIKGNYFKRLFIISIIAFISSLPITIYSNYEINFLSIIFSFIFVPFFHFIIFPLTILVFLFSFLSPLYSFIISFIEWIIELLSKITFLSFVFRKPSMIVVIMYYYIIIMCIYNKKNIILLVTILLFHYNINQIIPEQLVTYLDVGEGDSIILKNNNHLFLLDTGGNIYHSYSDNIIKYIKSLGMNKIDVLILSHGDFDHMGEAEAIINNLSVKQVVFNCGKYSDLEKVLIKVLDKRKITYNSCINKLNIDNSKLYFLQTREYDNENDNSNVIYLDFNGYKFLFMGDAGIEKEKDIINKYHISNIDILKVGHHGSKTSSSKEFINNVKPNYSIISVSKNNIYHHPNKEVLKILESSKIYRTDQDGSISITINNNLVFKTYPP